MSNGTPRVESEWVALNAFRGLIRIASKGDYVKSTYNHALDLGGVLCPELLGHEASLLQRARESELAGEFRQKAELVSVRDKKTTHPLELIRTEIKDYQGLLDIAEQVERDKSKVDKMKRRLKHLIAAEAEIDPSSHSENQLIFRDAYNIDRNIPTLHAGRGYRDFQLPDDKILRVRVLHPDKPEHITGADIVYERHAPDDHAASIVAVQYKVWDDRSLYLSDPRMGEQLQKMAGFMCQNGICDSPQAGGDYRFPHCAAFLRPTDRLQAPDQKFISVGEHLPICKIQQCSNEGPRGGAVLEYGRMKGTSLTGDIFETLFNRGRVGSRMLGYDELAKLYSDHLVESARHSVVIYAQEF